MRSVVLNILQLAMIIAWLYILLKILYIMQTDKIALSDFIHSIKHSKYKDSNIVKKELCLAAIITINYIAAKVPSAQFIKEVFQNEHVSPYLAYAITVNLLAVMGIAFLCGGFGLAEITIKGFKLTTTELKEFEQHKIKAEKTITSFIDKCNSLSKIIMALHSHTKNTYNEIKKNNELKNTYINCIQEIIQEYVNSQRADKEKYSVKVFAFDNTDNLENILKNEYNIGKYSINQISKEIKNREISIIEESYKTLLAFTFESKILNKEITIIVKYDDPDIVVEPDAYIIKAIIAGIDESLSMAMTILNKKQL